MIKENNGFILITASIFLILFMILIFSLNRNISTLINTEQSLKNLNSSTNTKLKILEKSLELLQTGEPLLNEVEYKIVYSSWSAYSIKYENTGTNSWYVEISTNVNLTTQDLPESF